MNKNIKIISCKDCIYFQVQNINKNSQLYSCKLNKRDFDLSKLDVSTNKSCYKDKSSKKN